MTKKIKPAILLLMHLLLLQSTFGQIQVNTMDYLSQRFLKYCESVPREEIFVQSDREEYIAGEDLWFNIYLIDRQSFKPSLNSKIAYFELLNPENRPVMQKRILITEGSGPGQIIIPDTLSSGIYTIRAYTSWMKNFLPDNCFMKDIKVYNALNTKAFKGKSSTDNFLKAATSSENSNGLINTGLALKINNLILDNLEIFVDADEKYRSANSDLFYLFIQTHGKIDYVSTERLLGGNTKITVPKRLLTYGINQVTLFDSKGRPIIEKFIYTPGKENQLLTLRSIDNANRRDKITLEIETGNEISSELNAANISISIAPKTNNNKIVELGDYMIFGTEFGIVSWNTIKSKKINELPPEVIDSLLGTLKSNWINWEAILSDNLPRFKYQVEKEDHYLFGSLLTKNKQPADSNKYVLLSTPGKKAIFQYAITDNRGNFNFNLHIDGGLKDLLIQPGEIINNQTIKIESSFSDRYFQSEILVDSANKSVPDYISTWRINYQVRKIYESTSTGDSLTANIQQLTPKRFYGKPDVELIMDDYIKLPVMQEVFFELVPGVILKSKKSVYELSITDPVENKPYEVPPCLMIDGVIVKDPSIIANLDPELVEKIDVERNVYVVGDYLFYGIVNIITETGDYSSVSLPGYAIRTPYRIIDPVVSFKSPDYSSIEMKNSRNPDFRNTLYWNPSIDRDKNGKAKIDFWSSDIASDYEVNIQGITSKGKIISYKKIIRIN